MLNWQVTHHAAVKSTNTGRPAARALASTSGDQACQRGADRALDAVADAAVLPATGSCSPGQAQASVATHIAAASAVPRPRARPRPGVPIAQHSSAVASSTPSSAVAPSMPVCWPSTQTSQTTVANIGNAIATLKRTIHTPGRGRCRAMPGSAAISR